MKNRIEDFIRKNKAAFKEPDVRTNYMWEGVKAALTQKAYKKKVNRWRMAAAVLALLSLGQTAVLISNVKLHFKGSRPTEQMPASGFLSLEQAYIQQVNALQQQVKEKGVNLSNYSNLYDELHYLEQVEEDVEGDILLANNKERIAEMLANTYEKKIQLLERLLQQIERQEQVEKTLKAL